MKRLVLRLSSLGDLILASSILDTLPQGETSDWATSKGFGELLKQHPRVNQVLEFDRSLGFQGWVRFCRQVFESDYDEIYDLHRTLRTHLLKFLFFYWSLFSRTKKVRWFTVSKQRVRLYGYFLFKGLWPHSWRPTQWIDRFRLSSSRKFPQSFLAFLVHRNSESEAEPFRFPSQSSYFCVMPSSQWEGKNWPVRSYIELLAQVSDFPVILGTARDLASVQLCEELEKRKIPHFNAVGKWSLLETAQVFSRARFYLGGDTGLAHLAEAVGTPVRVIFGPTTPDVGFAPRLPQSVAIGSDLWCRPCGKDGRNCFRLFEKYLCLKQVTPAQVLKTLGQEKEAK